MSRELDDIVEKILADPDDDEPRLAAAEVFDREDPPRAEHVRIGVEAFRVRVERALAEMEGEPPPPWPIDGIHRRDELERDHGRRWVGALAEREGCGCRLDRGFVGGVSIAGDRLLAIPDAELAAHPIDVLDLRASPAPLEAVLRLPIARRVSELRMPAATQTPNLADFEALASWEPGERCVAIRMLCGYLPSLDPVLASPALRRLGMLGLRDMRAHGDEGVWASERAARAEARYGLVPALRPQSVDPATMTPRLARELTRRGLADRVIDRRPIAGTVRGVRYDLYSTRYPTQEIFSLLRERGYEQDPEARLRYDITEDVEAGWTGGIYFLVIQEHSDAPVADEIDRILARRR